MVKCKKCDTTYSAEFKRCPNCGSRKRQGARSEVRNSPAVNAVVIIVFILALALSAYLVKSAIDPSFTLKGTVMDMLGIQKEEPEQQQDEHRLEGAFDPDLDGEHLAEENAEGVNMYHTPEELAQSGQSGGETVGGEVKVESIVLGQYDSAPIQPGAQLQLSADVYPASSQELLAWRSDDPMVATVDSKGLVTAVAPGTATIVAEALDKTASCLITVAGWTEGEGESDEDEPVEPVEAACPYENLKIYNVYQSASLFPGEMSIARGDQVQMLLAGDGEKVTEGIEWSVKNTSVATITESGLVKGAGSGMTTIIAKLGDKTAECIVRVN